MERMIAVRNQKTIYRDGDRCIKVFHEGYAKADILNEALNQARIEETGLHVPRVLEVTTVGGKWAIVSEYIKGKNLAQLMQEKPDKIANYLTMFVDLQLEVHGQTCPMLPKLKDKMKRKISQSELDATIRCNLHARLESMPEYNQVCHGDFNPSNIILDEDGTPYILDWSHAAQGNASADAAHTCLLFCLHGESGTAEKYLNLFCQKSGIGKADVQNWLPIAAASQSVRGNAHERECLLRWVHVVDYQ